MKDRNFCNKLITLRKRTGLTQFQLEERADLKVHTVSRYETGEKEPRLTAIKKLIKGLGCTADELLS